MSPIQSLFAALAQLPASLHAQFDPIGTITAVVDGEPRTWYIPGASIEDGGSGEGSEEVSILLLPRAGVYNVMHGMEEGALNATRIDAQRSGGSAFAGTFSGTLVDNEGGGSHGYGFPACDDPALPVRRRPLPFLHPAF